MAKETKSFDKIIIGVIPGLILPLITMYLIYEFKEIGYSFEVYLRNLYKYNMITKAASLSLISNLIVFYLFLQTLRYKSAKGVVLSTLIYSLLILAYMLFF